MEDDDEKEEEGQEEEKIVATDGENQKHQNGEVQLTRFRFSVLNCKFGFTVHRL